MNSPERKTTAMKLSTVIEKLSGEGYAATPGRIRQALRNGYVRPLPEKVARGAYLFTRQHLAQLRRYFVNVRPGPSPFYPEDLPIIGVQDRVHRLARERQRLRDRGPSERARREQARKDTDAAIEWLEQIGRELAS